MNKATCSHCKIKVDKTHLHECADERCGKPKCTDCDVFSACPMCNEGTCALTAPLLFNCQLCKERALVFGDCNDLMCATCQQICSLCEMSNCSDHSRYAQRIDGTEQVVCDRCYDQRTKVCYVCSNKYVDADMRSCAECLQLVCADCGMSCDHDHGEQNGQISSLTSVLQVTPSCKMCTATCNVCGGVACYDCRINTDCDC